MFQPVPETLDLDLLVLPETNLILFASVIEPLRVVNRIVGRDLYRWTIFSPDGRPAETRSGISIPAAGAFRPDKESHPLFILSSHNWDRYTTPALKRVLSKTARHRSMVAGIEAGGWLLAEVGLLASVRATTHWEDMEDFSAAFPGVDVRPDRYVIDGPVFTTGGASPTFDLMLHLVRTRLGMAIALDVASVFIYDQARSATDAQPLVSLGRLDGYDPRLAQAIRLMEAHVDQPLTIDAVAKRAGVTARTLESIFRRSIGETPGAYYLRLRLSAARRLVVDTKVAMADIAGRTGFSSAAAFSRAFSRAFGEAPVRLRRS